MVSVAPVGASCGETQGDGAAMKYAPILEERTGKPPMFLYRTVPKPGRYCDCGHNHSYRYTYLPKDRAALHGTQRTETPVNHCQSCPCDHFEQADVQA